MAESEQEPAPMEMFRGELGEGHTRHGVAGAVHVGGLEEARNVWGTT